MSIRLRILLYLILSFLLFVLDFSVSCFTYGRGFHLRTFLLMDFYNFHVTTALLELWFLSIIRLSIISGCLLAIVINLKQSLIRLKKCNIFFLACVLVMWVIVFTKMLIYTEYHDCRHDYFFWGLFSNNVTFTIIFYANYLFISSIEANNLKLSKDSYRNLNLFPEEREQLISDDDKDNNSELSENESDNSERSDESSSSEKKSTNKDENRVSSSKIIICMLKLSLPDLHIIFFATIFLILASSSKIFLPYFTGLVIDGIAIEHDQGKFIKAIIYLTLVDVASTIFSGCRGALFKLAIARYQVRICSRLFDALMKQDMGFYDNIQTGEVTSRLTSDTVVMTQTLGLNLNIFLRNVIQMIGAIFFMIKLSWRLSILTLIGLPILMIVSQIYGSYYEILEMKIQSSLAKANVIPVETCSSIRTVRSFANEDLETTHYKKRLQKVYKLKKKEAFAYAGYMWSTRFLESSLIISTLFYGGHLVVHSFITGGDLISFLLYSLELGYYLESIANVYTGLMQAVGASRKVFEYIDKEPLIKLDSGRLIPFAFEGSITFKDVTFAYPSRKDFNVLKSVSFHINPGEIVALVGPSGGGKSTCVNLIERFYDTIEGEVLLNDVSIQDYDHNFLHDKVTLVGQEPVLYARSIKENIAYGVKDESVLSEELIEMAAKDANAHEFIMKLPKKYKTQVGEKGSKLSGGQKQRIAIARALIKKPAILLLDEATSALDTESELKIQNAIYNRDYKKTIVIIAHRLSTVIKADRILVISKGELVEQGPHHQLLEQKGLYYKLVKNQLGIDFESE